MLALEKLLYILIDSIEIMEKLGMTEKRLDGVFLRLIQIPTKIT